MTDAQGNQLTYRQIAERMTLEPWTGKEEPAQPAPAPSAFEPKPEQAQSLLPV